MFVRRSIFFLILVTVYIVCGQETASVESSQKVAADESSKTTTAETSDEANRTASASSGDTNTETKEFKNHAGTSKESDTKSPEIEVPVQSGPFIDLLGERLYSLEMIDESRAQMHAHYTNEVLRGKKVVGLYFSADW